MLAYLSEVGLIFKPHSFPPGMVTLWPTMKRCAAIAKKELNYFGPWGFTAWLCGTIFIERSRPNQAHSTMLRAGDIVKEKKVISKRTCLSGLDCLINFQ